MRKKWGLIGITIWKPVTKYTRGKETDKVDQEVRIVGGVTICHESHNVYCCRFVQSPCLKSSIVPSRGAREAAREVRRMLCESRRFLMYQTTPSAETLKKLWTTRSSLARRPVKPIERRKRKTINRRRWTLQKWILGKRSKSHQNGF